MTSRSSWWKRTSNYLASHSNLLVVTGGLVGGAYLLSQYAITKFQQVQEKLVQDKNAKENLRRRFAQNQEDCTFTVLALLPTLGEQLFSKLNVEQLTESLRTQAPPLPKPGSAYNSEPEGPAKEPSVDGEHLAPTANGTNQPPSARPLSPSLNPLAKSFVPGGSPVQPAPAEAQPPQPAEVATPEPSQAEPTSQPEKSIANGTQPSHQDAQEQRNKILAERQAKLRLWNELKTTAFARTVTSMYCVVLLTLQTHIQLNLIGRFAYLSSVEAQAQELEAQQQEPSFGFADFQDRFGLDHETERLYLTFSWWFLHQGWNTLSDRVSNAVEKVLSPLSVKAQLSIADVKALLGDARTIIEHDANTGQDAAQPWKRANFLSVLFPSSIEDEAAVLAGAGAATADDARLTLRTNAKLRALLDETKDIIESDDFSTILRLCIDRVFEVFYNSLNPSFGIQQTGLLDTTAPTNALDSRFQELTDEMQLGKKIRLASLFPVVTRQSQMAIHGVPNEYTENLAESKELRAFSAVIYAAWSQA